MLLYTVLALSLLSAATHARVLDSTVDCTILLSCMEVDECLRFYVKRFGLEYCLDSEISSGLEKRTNSLKKILQNSMANRLAGGK
ncbi:hypothetical protein PFISCL1PPCAC_811, partial [Pristionchus fissidentatus]